MAKKNSIKGTPLAISGERFSEERTKSIVDSLNLNVPLGIVFLTSNPKKAQCLSDIEDHLRLAGYDIKITTGDRFFGDDIPLRNAKEDTGFVDANAIQKFSDAIHVISSDRMGKRKRNHLIDQAGMKGRLILFATHDGDLSIYTPEIAKKIAKMIQGKTSPGEYDFQRHVDVESIDGSKEVPIEWPGVNLKQVLSSFEGAQRLMRFMGSMAEYEELDNGKTIDVRPETLEDLEQALLIREHIEVPLIPVFNHKGNLFCDKKTGQ